MENERKNRVKNGKIRDLGLEFNIQILEITERKNRKAERRKSLNKYSICLLEFKKCEFSE